MTDQVLKRGLKLITDKVEDLKTAEDDNSFVEVCIALRIIIDTYLYDTGERVITIRMAEDGALTITKSLLIVPEKQERDLKNEILDG